MARTRSVSPSLDLVPRGSNSPPPQPQSKRDKRRALMAERLHEMINSFNMNLRPHYEVQANAIQVDISLILHANPYENTPLEDSTEEVEKQLAAVVGDKIGPDPALRDDFIAEAGKLYSEYIKKVNDAMEERDINLNLLHNKYQGSLHEIRQRHQFQVQLAQEEHRLLAETIRERLVASLGKKKERLQKEKEQLDIGDSNALLLHPNQFSIINPASPGTGQKRATRGTGRRAADPDDPAAVLAQDKRKRKNLLEEAEGQSPASGATRVDVGSGTPYRDLRTRNEYHQHVAPAYSVDRLFTEKELQLTMNRAAIAATNFLVRLKNQNTGQANGNANGGGGDEPHGEGADETGANPAAGAANDIEMEDDATPAAPEMERGVSQSHHATRGATRNLLVDLASVATADFPIRHTVPTYIPAAMGAKANSAPASAAPLSAAEVEQDLAFMRRDTHGDDPYNNRLLERAFAPTPQAEYQYRPPSLVPDIQDGAPSLLPVMGGVPMSAQSSAAGHSDIGGLPMSRNGSSMGGVGMKRTASSSGLLGVNDATRRAEFRKFFGDQPYEPRSLQERLQGHIIDPDRNTGPLRRKPKPQNPAKAPRANDTEARGRAKVMGQETVERYSMSVELNYLWMDQSSRPKKTRAFSGERQPTLAKDQSK